MQNVPLGFPVGLVWGGGGVRFKKTVPRCGLNKFFISKGKVIDNNNKIEDGDVEDSEITV